MNANPEEELLTEKMSFRCRPSLKNAIQNAARLVKRKPAAWIVIELEKIIERQSKLTAQPTPETQPEAPVLQCLKNPAKNQKRSG
jgi:hypothetical protein